MLKPFKRAFTDNILGLAPNIFQLTRYKDIPEYGHFFWSQLCPYIKSQLHVIFKAKQFTICARFKQANKPTSIGRQQVALCTLLGAGFWDTSGIGIHGIRVVFIVFWYYPVFGMNRIVNSLLWVRGTAVFWEGFWVNSKRQNCIVFATDNLWFSYSRTVTRISLHADVSRDVCARWL